MDSLLDPDDMAKKGEENRVQLSKLTLENQLAQNGIDCGQSNLSATEESNSDSEDNQDVIIGTFCVDEKEVETFSSIFVEASQSPSPPPKTQGDEEDSNLSQTKETTLKLAVFVKNKNDGSPNILTKDLKLVLDKSLKKVGIWIPELEVEQTKKSLDLVVLLQSPPSSKLVKYSIEADHSEKADFVKVRKHFVRLSPMNHAGSADLTKGIDDDYLDKVIKDLGQENIEDLLKSYGSNEDSLLMTLCCQKNDLPEIRAQFFALLSRILEEANEEALEMVSKSNQLGLTALDYATMANNSKISAFLIKLFYILGKDVFGSDYRGNTILHMMARKGNLVAPTLEKILSLTFKDHLDGKRVFRADTTNDDDEMPVHIAAMNKTCSAKVIHLLLRDCPFSVLSPTLDGSLPLHLACQFSADPKMLTLFLIFDETVVNYPRDDGLTPLHLVAARSNVQDVKNGLIKISVECQVEMIQTLIGFGADVTAKVEDTYYPFDLLPEDRTEAKDLLKLPKPPETIKEKVKQVA